MVRCVNCSNQYREEPDIPLFLPNNEVAQIPQNSRVTLPLSLLSENEDGLLWTAPQDCGNIAPAVRPAPLSH